MTRSYNQSRLLIITSVILIITLPFLQLSAKKKRRSKKKKGAKQGYLVSILGKSSHNSLIVNSNYGFLRTGPGKNFAKIKRLRLNEKLRYLGDAAKVKRIENQFGVYMLVSYKKQRGYFFSGYVDIPLSKKLLTKQRWLNTDPLGAKIKFSKKGTFTLRRLGQNTDSGTYKIINRRIHMRLDRVKNQTNRQFARMRCAYTVDLNHFTYQAFLFCKSATAKVRFANERYRVPAGQIRLYNSFPMITTGAKAIKLEAATKLYTAPGKENFYMNFSEGFTSEDSLRFSLNLVKVHLLARSKKKYELDEQDGHWCLVRLPVSNEGVTDFDRMLAFIFLKA